MALEAFRKWKVGKGYAQGYPTGALFANGDRGCYFLAPEPGKKKWTVYLDRVSFGRGEPRLTLATGRSQEGAVEVADVYDLTGTVPESNKLTEADLLKAGWRISDTGWWWPPQGDHRYTFISSGQYKSEALQQEARVRSGKPKFDAAEYAQRRKRELGEDQCPYLNRTDGHCALCKQNHYDVLKARRGY